MDENFQKYIKNLIKRYPELNTCKDDIIKAYKIMEESYSNGGKLLIAGNGGSATDAEHIAGELMKRFKLPRPVPTEFASKLTAVDP